MTPSPAEDPSPSGTATSHSDAQRAFFADGAALGLSAFATALIGLLGWLLAARLLEPAQVGRASAFVNGFVFVAGVAELGLGQACLKWLPGAGRHTRTILLRVGGGVLASAVVVSVVWGSVTHSDIAEQTGLATAGALLLFVVASVGWTLFHVQNMVLTSVGAARWVPVEMLLFGVVRIVLLVLLARPLGPIGIVLSWVLPTAVVVVVVPLLLARVRHRRDGEPGVLPTRHSATRMATSIYVSTFGMTLMVSLVPLVLTARYGPAVGAVFFIVWNGVAAIELAAAGFGSALVVRLTGDSMVLLRGALRQVLPLFGVPLLVAAVAAEPLLAIFGAEYADVGTTMLRWVCAGLLVRVVGVMIVGIHLEAERTVRLVLVNTAPAVAMIVAIALVPTGGGLATLGAAYFVIQLVVTAVATADLALGRGVGRGA